MAGRTLRSRDELLQAICEIDKNIDFGDAHLELLSDARMDALMHFTKHHIFPDEVMAKSTNYVMDMQTEEFLKQLLSGHLSLILVSNKTNEIIAARGIVISKKDTVVDLSKIRSKQLQASFGFITQKNDVMNVYKRFGVDTCVEFNVLGTHTEHRKRGIGTKIFQAALLFCKELGLDPVCIKGEASSNYSQRIYEKHGFEAIHTFRYDEYKVNDEIVFKNTGEHESLKVYVKQLV